MQKDYSGNRIKIESKFEFESNLQRSGGVRLGKCRGGEQSRLRCVFLDYLPVAGTQKDGPRARQGKVSAEVFANPLFF